MQRVKNTPQAICKRLFDLCLATTAIILFLPLWITVSIAIILDSGLPVFFFQERAGQYGRSFRIIKFRTMVKDAEDYPEGVFTHKEDPRITRVGKWLRKLSLDELPQLFNVLRGEMSIVGPRPTLLYQIEKYDARQKKRLLVKPGITGWAQINGRNLLTWPERIELDVWYVENWSLWLDLQIIIRTPIIVFKQQGIYGERKKDPIAEYPQKRLPS